MPKRKAHNKSRSGCQNCKTRHIKCDEQRPTCANCVVRNIACIYLQLSVAETSRIASSARRPQNGSTDCNSQQQSAASSSGRSLTLAASPTPSQSISLLKSLSSSPTAFSIISESDRLLELELMHRWSTRTWTGLYSTPEDKNYLQVILPRAALRENFLMNGILAVSALDLARCSPPSSSSIYLCAALEYSNKASASFRAQLSNINSDNLHLLYIFAMMAAVFNFAMPSQHLSMTERIALAFDMLIGASDVALSNIQWLIESPFDSLRTVMMLANATIDDIDPDTKNALDRLKAVSQIRVPITNAKYEDQESALAGEAELYRIALAQLTYCFAEDARGLIGGYGWSFPVVAGRGFVTAIRKSEPMALFILMHFGVLSHRQTSSFMTWWAESAGRELVREVSGNLLRIPFADTPGVREGIYWAQQQVCC